MLGHTTQKTEPIHERNTTPHVTQSIEASRNSFILKQMSLAYRFL